MDRGVRWRQVVGLALFQSTAIVGWLAYGHFQPRLLERFEFQALAPILVIIQGVLGALLNPLMGHVSDRMKGRGFAVIVVAVGLAGLVFVAVALGALGSPTGVIRTFFPGLLVLWLMGMCAFNSPAIALLRGFAVPSDLPKATAVISLSFTLVYALNPLLGVALGRVGTTGTFLLGGGFLVLATWLLSSLRKGSEPMVEPAITPKWRWWKAIVFGGLIGIVVNTCFTVAPARLALGLQRWGSIRAEYVTSGCLLVSAACVLPMARVAMKHGLLRFLILGLVLLPALTSLSLVALPAAACVGLGVVFGAVHSFIYVSGLSIVLGEAPPPRAGLATGLFFGGMSLASAIVVYAARAFETAEGLTLAG